MSDEAAATTPRAAAQSAGRAHETAYETAHETADELPDDGAPPAELLRLRASIDNIDAALIHLLAERFKATQAVGVLKAARRMPPADPRREEEQVARLRALAQEAGLDPVFAEKFLAFVIAEVIRHHEQIAALR